MTPFENIGNIPFDVNVLSAFFPNHKHINEKARALEKNGQIIFDIDIAEFRKLYPEARYMVFCNNVYSGLPFGKCFCKAGYMTRDIEDTGAIYEPKTVKSAFMINCDSTFAYLFGIDLDKNELIWLNMARTGSMAVAGMTDMTMNSCGDHAAGK